MDDNQFQILGRLQAQARSQASELDALQTSLVLKQRESKKSQVVQSELNSLVGQDKDVRLYKAFGKAFTLEKPQMIIKDYKTQDKEAAEEAQGIQKKVKWLEKELKSSQSSLNEFYARIQMEGTQAA